MDKISVQYSEFDRLYASELELTTTDEDRLSAILKKHPNFDSESSTHRLCHGQVAMASDATEGTEGCVEVQSDPKADITELITADNKVVDSANIPLENTLADTFECGQLSECAGIE